MSVDLPAGVKGAHLSRFVGDPGRHRRRAQPAGHAGDPESCGTASARASAGSKLSFPFFLRRAAPVTGATALMDYQCWLAGATQRRRRRRSCCGVRVPVTSVCPCSKAISDYGAHNQRATITIRVCPRDEEGLPARSGSEDLIEVAEAAASSPVFPLLKRPDERHVTMHAHDHPVFVEDMVRGVAEALSCDERIAWFSVEAANDESIHNHARVRPHPLRRLPRTGPQQDCRAAS